MKVSYLDHATYQIKERGIKKKLVREILLAPDQIVIGHKKRKIAQKIVFEGKFKFLYRVVYLEENKSFVVVTAYKTTNIKRYWVKK